MRLDTKDINLNVLITLTTRRSYTKYTLEVCSISSLRRYEEIVRLFPRIDGIPSLSRPSLSPAVFALRNTSLLSCYHENLLRVLSEKITGRVPMDEMTRYTTYPPCRVHKTHLIPIEPSSPWRTLRRGQ